MVGLTASVLAGMLREKAQSPLSRETLLYESHWDSRKAPLKLLKKSLYRLGHLRRLTAKPPRIAYEHLRNLRQEQAQLIP
jgi:hypothetical protein